MKTLKFSKMHGLGNDFMVVDAINQQFEPNPEILKKWANRHTGIGFDQFLLVEKAQQEGVDFRYRIFNADGGEVEQCGNGARCFVRFVSDKGLSEKKEIVVETAKGIIRPRLNDDGSVTVNMGKPRFAAQEVPFILRSGEVDEAKSYVVVNGIDSAAMSMVSMGNPHAVMMVEDTETAPVAEWGNALQAHPRFPERVNVGFMQVLTPNYIKLRVFERGSGETQACGTGACAAVVAGIRLGALQAGENITVSLPGGVLSISWQEGGDVMMTGPAQTVYEAELNY